MTLLGIEGLSVSLGKRPVLLDVDLSIDAGEMVGLIGPNGAGKTTLLRAMAGLLTPERGAVRVSGEAIESIARRSLAQKLAYLPQTGESQWAVTVETLVGLGRLPRRDPWAGPSDADRLAVARAMESCDVTQFRARAVTQLSGGERSRVLLARALAGEPEILLADEPVAGLDPGHQLDVMQRLATLAASGGGVVVVMHDLTLAARYCDRLVLLYEGRIAAEGNGTEVLSEERLARCYGVRAYRGTADGTAIVVPVERMQADGDHAPG